jgi:hypothetical protein
MNLKDSRNPELRANVQSGHISVADLLTKSYQDLASAALKSEREAALKWEMQERRSDVSPHTTITDAFRCGKCQCRERDHEMSCPAAARCLILSLRCLRWFSSRSLVVQAASASAPTTRCRRAVRMSP